MCCFVIQLSVFAMQTCSLRDAHDISKELEEKHLKIQLTHVFRKTRFGKKERKTIHNLLQNSCHKSFLKILNRDFCFSLKFEHANYFRAKNTSYVNDFVKTYILIISK